MTLDIALLLFILASALVLFWLERLSTDVVALGVLLVLILARLLPPEEAFAGFGSDTVMMILGLLILTASLSRTGVIEIVGGAILRRTGDAPGRLVLVIMLAVSSLSAFMSNTAATAFFLPVAIGLSRRSGVSASRLLMPMAFASILSSSVTLISTTTNMVVSGLMGQRGMEPMGMFELAPVGIPIAVVGFLYVFFIGRRIVPDRQGPSDPTGAFGLRPYLTEAVVLPGSPLIGKSLSESGLRRDLGLTVLRVQRGARLLSGRPETRLAEGDVLVVEGERDSVLKIKDKAGIDIKADVELAEPALESEGVKLAETILLARSPLVGKSLKEMRFQERFGLQVLALNRHGETLRAKLSELRLATGDMMLVQGPVGSIGVAEEDGIFLVLGAVEGERPNYAKAPIAVGIFVGALLAATTKILPLPVAVILGSFLAFLTRCLTPEEAYKDVEWRVLILIGCMLALGRAMDSTGTAAYLASNIVSVSRDAGPLLLLTGFFALTVLLTQPMSNQAAAVVVLPVALETASRLGLNPRTFAMMIAVAASCSYLTPLEPSCLMVYGPGRYRFSDFVKAGSILTLLIYAIAIYLVPRVWPLG